MGLRFLSPDDKGDYQRPNTTAPFDSIHDAKTPRPRRKSTVMLVPPSTAASNKGKVQRWISAPYEHDEVSLPSLRRFANVLRRRSNAADDPNNAEDISMSMNFENEEYARRHSSVGTAATGGPSPFPRLIFDCDSDSSSLDPTDALLSRSKKVSRLDAIKRRFSRAKRNSSNKLFPRNSSSSDSLNNNIHNSHKSHLPYHTSHSHSTPLSNTSIVVEDDSMHALPPVIKSINHTHTEEPAHPVPLATPIAPETPAVHPHESLPREDKPSAPPDYPPPPRDDPSLSETHETKQQPEQLAQQDLSEIMEESIIVSQQVAAMESFSGDTIENDQPAEDCTRSSILSRKVSDTVNVFESMGGAQEKTQSSHHALGQFDASYVNDQIAVMERFKNALTDNSSDSSDDSQPAHAIPQVSSLENWSDARDDSRLNVPTVQSEEFIPPKVARMESWTDAIDNVPEPCQSHLPDSSPIAKKVNVFESMETIPVREILPSQMAKVSVCDKVAAMENQLESVPVVSSRSVDVQKSFETSTVLHLRVAAMDASTNCDNVPTESKFMSSKHISFAERVGVFESREANIETKPLHSSPSTSTSIADKVGVFESRAAQQLETLSNQSSPSNSKHVAKKVDIFESLDSVPSVTPKGSNQDKSSFCSSLNSNQNDKLATIDKLSTIRDEQAEASSRSHMDNYLSLKLASIDRAIKGRDNPNETASETSQSSQSRQYGLLDTTYVNQQIAAMERLNSALVNQLNKAERMDSLPPIPEEEYESVKGTPADVYVDVDQPENFDQFPGVEQLPVADNDAGSDSKSIPHEPASHSSLEVLPAVSCSDFQDKSSSSLTVDSNANHEIIAMDTQSQLNPVSLSSKIDIFESLGSGSYNLDSVAKPPPPPSNDNLEMNSRSVRPPVIEDDLYHDYEDEHPPYSRDSVTPVYLDPFSAEEPSMLANEIPIFIPEMKTVHSVEPPTADSSKLPLPPAIIESDTRYLEPNLSANSISEADKFADPEETIRDGQSDVKDDAAHDQVEPSCFERDVGVDKISRASSDIANVKNVSSPVDQEDDDDDIVELKTSERSDSSGNSPKDAKSERTSSSVSSRVPVPLAEYMNRKHKPDEAPPSSPTNSNEDPMDVDVQVGVPILDSIEIEKEPSPAKKSESGIESVEAASPSVSHDIFPKFNGPRVSQDLKSNTRGTPWRRSASRGVLPTRNRRHSLDSAQEDSVLSDALPADFRFAQSEDTEADDSSALSSQDSRSFAITTSSVEGAVGRIIRAYRLLEFRGARKTHVCGEIDLFYSARSNPGWEVTYNLVTSFVSNLLLDQASGAALHKAGVFDPPEREEICKRIEKAWRRGYNPEGAEKHSRRLVGKRAYIGTPEINAFLVSVGVGARERSFDTDNSWSRRAFFVWVYSHFQAACVEAGGCAMHSGRKLGRKRVPGIVIPPLLVQWSEHVLLVVGAEKSRKGDICLLVLEPSAEFIDKLKYRSVRARMGASRRAENHPTWTESNEFHVVYIDRQQHDPVTSEEEQADGITPIRSRTSSTTGTVERKTSNRKSNGSSLSMSFGWFRRTHNRLE